jgi:hypothetical protein
MVHAFPSSVSRLLARSRFDSADFAFDGHIELLLWRGGD